MTPYLAFWLFVSLFSLGGLLKPVVKKRSLWLVCIGAITTIVLVALYFHLPRFGSWVLTGECLIVAGITPRFELPVLGRVVVCAAATLIAAALALTALGLLR